MREKVGKSSIIIHHHPSPSIIIHHHPSASIIIHHHPSASISIHQHPSASISIHHHPSPSISIHHHPSSSIIIHHHPSSSIIIHHHPSSSIITHHHPSSSIIIHHHPVFSQWFGAPEGRKVGSAGAGQMRDEKLHAVVAQSTFRSQNVESTPRSDHFWQLRCRKSARRCGAKHISKSKCTKHTSVGPLLEVAMSKKCTPLWREAHSEVKMYKTHQRRTTFGSCDVEKVHAVVARSTFRSQNVENTPRSDHFWQLRCRKSARKGARSTLRSQNVKNTRGSDHFWRFRCWKSARRCGAKYISKSKC